MQFPLNFVRDFISHTYVLCSLRDKFLVTRRASLSKLLLLTLIKGFVEILKVIWGNLIEIT